MISLGYSIGPASARSATAFEDSSWKDGLKDIVLGGIGVATTFGLQALQNKLSVQGQPAPVIYAQQAPGGQYQVPGVYAPAPVDYSGVIKIGLLLLAAVVAVKAFKG